MKKFIIIIFAIVCSCLYDKDEINISGEIKGLNNSFIYLVEGRIKIGDEENNDLEKINKLIIETVENKTGAKIRA